MTKPKSKSVAALRSPGRKPSKSTAANRPARRRPSNAKTGVKLPVDPGHSTPSTRPTSKQALVLGMLRKAGGTTIDAIVQATDWQQHSVRGFLAGVVRRKLQLTLVSEPAEDGRVYRITDKAVPAAEFSHKTFQGEVIGFGFGCQAR